MHYVGNLQRSSLVKTYARAAFIATCLSCWGMDRDTKTMKTPTNVQQSWCLNVKPGSNYEISITTSTRNVNDKEKRKEYQQCGKKKESHISIPLSFSLLFKFIVLATLIVTQM